MGKLEKLVVLTVLFLSAIVLAISLNDGRKKAGRGSPVEAGLTQAPDPLVAVPSRGGAEPEAGAGSTRLLLSTEVTPLGAAEAGLDPTIKAGKAGKAGQAGAPAGSILRDTSALRPAGLDDYMVYTAAAGDTWAGLAERFYGSGRYVALLRHANEDMVSPLAGETILVPAYDFSAEAGQREPLVAREEGAARTLAASERDAAAGDAPAPIHAREASPAGAGSVASETQAELASATTYEVRAGDSLTGIAQRVYGSASRWKVLFEANRSVLRSADWLQVGTKLTVPRGAALQALASSGATLGSSGTQDEPAERAGKVR